MATSGTLINGTGVETGRPRQHRSTLCWTGLKNWSSACRCI